MRNRSSYILSFVIVLAPVIPIYADQTVSDSKERGRMEDILKRPEFNRWRAREHRALQLDRRLDELSQREDVRSFADKIKDFLHNLFGRRKNEEPIIDDNAATARTGIYTYGAIIAGTVALCLLAVWFLYRGVFQQSWKGNISIAVRKRRIDSALKEGEALTLDGASWMDVASSLAAKGEFRMAFRALYLSLLSSLHTKQKIDFKKSRTNWHYVNHFTGTTAEQSEFGSLTEMFDRIWYGNADADITTLNNTITRLKPFVTI